VGRARRTSGSGPVNTRIDKSTTGDCTITSAIPPVFDAYATIAELAHSVPYGSSRPRHEAVLVQILRGYGSSRWWLGYLDNGSDDVVFPLADKTSIYAGWPYVLVLAGPNEALGWRDSLPDLFFPDDHSWLVSTRWDDTWSCIGGPHALLAEVASEPLLDPQTSFPASMSHLQGRHCI
jgi:hypothetical protein